MKKLTGYLILAALLAIIVIQLMSNQKVSENRIYQYDKEQTIIVQSEHVGSSNEARQSDFTGTFEAKNEVKVSADVQGKIVAMYVDEGTKVVKGQKLIKLDDELLRIQLKSIEAQIEGLEADVKRFTILTEADAIQGVKLEKAALGLKSAKIQRETLLQTIAKTTVTAPFSGVFTMKMTDRGAFAAPGIPLLIITDISNLYFTVNVSEDELSLFKTNDTYDITADLFPDLKLKGKVSLIGSKGDMGNSFPVHFVLENAPVNKLKSKMFGKVQIEDQESHEAIMIPSSAIIGSDIQPKVYLIVDGKAKLQTISISRRFNNKAVVQQGVKFGDVVITSGFINLFDGANVASAKK